MFTLKDVLEIAVNLEKNGRKFYEEAMVRVKDPTVLDLLRQLRDQELHHLETFRRLRDLHVRDTNVRDVSPRGMEDFVRDSMSGRLLSWNEKPAIDGSQSYREILESALEFEQDSVTFFRFMSEMVDGGEEKRVVDLIIREELAHVERLAGQVAMLG